MMNFIKLITQPKSDDVTDKPCAQRRRVTDKPPTPARIRQLYERPDSFTNLLPWREYDPEQQCFLLDDGVSVAALFEITPVGAEARTAHFLAELRDKLQTVLTSLPEELNHPWVLQLYLQDEANLGQTMDEIRAYVHPRAQGSDLTKTYLATLDAHLSAISRSGGLFTDALVTGNPWRGQVRRVRATLYRRSPPAKTLYGTASQTPAEALNDTASKLVTALHSAGIRVHRCGGRELYDWLFRWFNPNPPITGGETEALLTTAPYPGDGEMPFGFDFAESLMLGMPHSDLETGLWWFDALPHKVVTVQSLRRIPEIGLFGAERNMGDHLFAVFDRAPENTILAMTITIKAQDTVRHHLAQIQRAAVGDYPEAQLAGQDAEKGNMEMAKGNKLFPVQIAFFVRGDDTKDCHRKINALNSLLLTNNLQPILEKDDLIAQDSYLRNLPMNYDLHHDKREARRSRLMFSKHIANLMPLYGRSTGTGHPGLLFFNRGAEPLTFDPLNILDRKKNGHALIIGPTGAGKSALLVYLILQMIAIYRPRVFIIEVGNSFGLLGQYLKAHQLSVNHVSLTPNTDVSLPPFGEARPLLDSQKKKHIDATDSLDGDEITLLEQALEQEEREDRAKRSDGRTDDSDSDGDDNMEETGRDILGEMEIVARIMITGGEPQEDDRMTRADRLLIRQAILNAANQVYEDDRQQVLTEDVVEALRHLTDLTPRRKERAQEMADGLSLFCDGLAGHFFNRPGSRWPDVDVTITDIGILAREGYEDQLTVAYIGLMNHIHDLVERHQNDDRPTIVITDEGHLITTNPLLSPYVIKIVKMWRKLGAWFWIATQNLEDFPDASRKMLNMLEWWLCLVMPKDEIEQLARFKELSDEQRHLLLAARKSSGQYTEGVLLTDEMTTLFRNVPPPLALALAMTEKEEKAHRHQLMREHGCDELAAVHLVAAEIAKKRGVVQ